MHIFKGGIVAKAKGEGEAAVAVFNRIIEWATKHKKAKAILPSLNKPATAKALAEFETKTKLKLPESFAAIYRLHDGQDEGAANEALDENSGIDSVESGLFPSIEGEGDLAHLLVPLKEMASSMRGSQMPGFTKGWVPFGSNYGGDNIVLDLASTDAKKRGRVLQFNHEYGGAFEIAPSFTEYLEHIADGLESKKIVWDDDAGLSYKKGRDWDDLIDKKQVEYDPKFVAEFGGEG
jgi:cell wall assembly regulator SMI1